jgi:hypothetical protein
MVSEISVYLPNIPGQFSKVLRALARENVSIRGFSVDLLGATSQLRMLFSDPDETERAMQALADSNFEPSPTNLLLLARPDAPGELLKITEVMADNDINVEYGYVALGHTEKGEVLLALKVEDGKELNAISHLKAAGIADHDTIPGVFREPPG